MNNLNIHNVTKIEKDIMTIREGRANEYHVLNLNITDDHGETIVVSLYAKNKSTLEVI